MSLSSVSKFFVPSLGIILMMFMRAWEKGQCSRNKNNNNNNNNNKTTESSHIGHCTHTSESTDVKVQ